MTLRKRGLEPVTQVPGELGPVRATPALKVTTKEGKGRVSVRVEVTAPSGVRAVPDGEIMVTVGDRRKRVALDGGTGRARFGYHRRMRGGRYRLSVKYGGDGAFLRTKSDPAEVRLD